MLTQMVEQRWWKQADYRYILIVKTIVFPIKLEMENNRKSHKGYSCFIA